ncbi:MAG: stalk domain-containing protein [Dehalobacterium sp.]
MFFNKEAGKSGNSPLGKLSELKRLGLSSCNISDLGSMGEMPSLDSLDLSFNMIADKIIGATREPRGQFSCPVFTGRYVYLLNCSQSLLCNRSGRYPLKALGCRSPWRSRWSGKENMKKETKIMKKVLSTGILVILLLLVLSGAVTAKENDIQVKINCFWEWGEIGQNTLEFADKEKPRIERGRVMIPLRKISEHFGYTVVYNEKTERINMTDNNGKKVELTLGSKKASVNNIAAELDVPAKTINGVTFVPLRFISEGFDQAVRWDTSTGTVFIDNFIISTPEYLFNQKTLELSKRDQSGKGKHLVLDKIEMSVDWVSMRVTKTQNGNDIVVIDNNSGAPHLYHDTYTIYVSENKIIDQSAVYALFSGKAVLSADKEKVVVGDGKTARVYDDKTQKLLAEYDLRALFGAEKDPNPVSHWETAYVVLGFRDNYILVKDTFKMLTKIVYLDSGKIVNIFEAILPEEEQAEALQDAGPFGNGDGIGFIEEKNGKLIFQKSYMEGPNVKTRQIEYSLENL